MSPFKTALLCVPAFILAACASMPQGPMVQALPPQGKPFEQFAAEQDMCKQYAASQIQGQAEEANNTGVLEGIGGTILGAGLGAAVGGGNGAAIGAAAGALGGTAVGASTSGHQQGGLQMQYDNAYTACMTSKGNQVQRPVVQQRVIVRQAPPPPPVVYYAPPPVVYEAPPGYYEGW
ncbi:MAG: glycine zipper family protein [Alphaproteobacteria bacterium]|nr:glycine zipper family protein [Alphaproteobacteria bacterium]